MKDSLNGQPHISGFSLKEYVSAALSGELKGCGFHILLGFEASARDRICTLRFLPDQRLDVCVNLSHLKKTVPHPHCSLLCRVYYGVQYIAAYIHLLERAGRLVPQSYLEGLSFLNAVEVYQSAKPVSITTPLYRWKKKPGRKSSIRPIEISCAVSALNRMRFFLRNQLSEKERILLEDLADKLLLYAGVPEIAYDCANVPVYALNNSVGKLAVFLEKNPGLAETFPVLRLMEFKRIGQLTTDDLLSRYVQSDNSFLLGIAIRMTAFSGVTPRSGPHTERQGTLISAMNRYIENSLTYYKELSQAEELLLKDNLYAVKETVKAINHYLYIHGAGVNSGNIHLY